MPAAYPCQDLCVLDFKIPIFFGFFYHKKQCFLLIKKSIISRLFPYFIILLPSLL